MRLIKAAIIILCLATTLMLGQQDQISRPTNLLPGRCGQAQPGKERFMFELMLPQTGEHDTSVADCPAKENLPVDWTPTGSFFSFAAF